MTSKVVNSIDLPILHSGGPHAGTAAAQSRVGERLDLVEHVKVRVTVSLGETEIPISKLFALGSGDVLALDREADAPVDIRVNDRLIARGVLVAVGDQFGVRITEIEAR
jgi:flagellar motor switch protein FliN/FliY